MTEDVRPLCIFCHQRFSLAAGQETPCPDPRTSWGHIEFWRSTKEQRDARFGPPAVRPTQGEHAAAVAALAGKTPSREPEPSPQMGFGL